MELLYSLDWMVRALRRYYAVQIYGDINRNIKRLEALEGGVQPEDMGVLYLTSSPNVLRTLNLPVSGTICYLTDAPVPSDIELSGFTSLVVVTCENVGSVYAQLANILFEEGTVNTPANEFLAGLLSCRTLEEMVSLGSVFLKNPFAIIQADGKLLASAYGEQTINDGMFENYTQLLSTMQVPTVHTGELLEISARTGKAVFDASGNAEVPDKIWKKMISGGVSLGFAVLLGAFHQVSSKDAAMLDILCNFLSMELLRRQSQWQILLEDDRCLKQYLESDGRQVLANVQAWLEQEGQDDSERVIMVLNLRRTSITQQIPLPRVQERLRKLSKDLLVTQVDAGVVLYEKLRWQGASSLSADQRFANILDEFHLLAGISLTFHSVAGCLTAFRQAGIAIEFGNRLNPACTCFCYRDYALYAALHDHAKTFDLHALIYPGLEQLLAEDEENHGDYLKLLETYLATGCKKARTAKQMYVHINTVKYRLAQISTRLGVDLDNPEVVFSLELSLRVLRYFDLFSKDSFGR